MKEIEVKVTKYVAEDGTQFDSKELCEKHDVECAKSNDDCDARIALIRQKRKCLDDEAEAKRRKEEAEYEDNKDKIRKMGSRIRNLIAVANELINNNLFYYADYSSVDFLRRKYSYKGNIYFTQDDPQYSYCNEAHKHKGTGIGFIAVSGNGRLATNGTDFITFDSCSYGRAVMSKRMVEELEELERAFYAYVEDAVM